MRSVLAVTSLLATVTLSGCAAAVLGTAGAVGLTSVQEKTLGEAVDDATTSNEIKAKLLNESGARFAEVDVEVASGLVLLSGRVNAPEDRTYAEGIAWSSSRTLMSPMKSGSSHRAASSRMSRTKSSPAGSAPA